jgi:putative endopeptidase
MLRHALLLSLGVFLIACKSPQPSGGIDRTLMDPTVSPKADLYRHMNGTWLKTFDIPADKSNYGTFSKLADDAEKQLQAIIEESGKSTTNVKGSPEQKVGDMYSCFMDSASVEKRGIEGIAAALRDVEQVKDKSALTACIARLNRQGISGPVAPFVSQDGKNATRYIVNIYQDGLSLPDRDYYLKDDARFKEIRTKFVDHIRKMFALAGIKDGEKKAADVMAIEMEIARAHWSKVDNRDRSKTYNKLAVTDLDKLTPSFGWKTYATAAGFGDQDSVVVYQPTYVKALEGIIARTSVEDWKTYYTWQVLHASASYLGVAYVNESFDFFEHTVQGIQEIRPRWKRGVSTVEETMGELVGKVYVARHFKPEAKERMVKLVDNLKSAFWERIQSLTWMGAETKTKALQKLDKFTAKIGYPDKWRDYSKLEVVPGDLVGNIHRASEFEFDRQLQKLGKPIDRTEWLMTPQTVNAYYSPTMNEVVFPAAILQPPFFNVNADEAVNYGAIGAVIGHEMTHGFDDQGRKSDGDGNLTDWWTPTDGAEFEKRAKMMVAQYNQFIPIDSAHVNGELTLGENIADLGGLTVAYYAYKKSLNGKEAPVIGGLSGDQRFFLGWSQVWARKYRDDELRRRLVIDPHSPSEYRANGVVANMPEFYAAFDIKPGDPLYRPDSVRVKIW